jgi:glycosyltransferase involved in cell wall biosynthesis
MTTISVVVPCYPPHQKLIPEFLEQFEKQTVKPDEIIIALSEVSDEDIAVLRGKWISKTTVPLQVVGQEIKALAAVNRNYGAMHSFCDYVQFLDADDKYHIRLIEIIKKTIKEKSPDAIIYHLSEDEIDLEGELILRRSYNCEELFEKAYPNKERDVIKEQYLISPQLFLDYPVHFGHVCVKYSFWQECLQDDLKGREDSVYVRSILWKWWKEGCKSNGLIVIPEVLTFYEKNMEHVLEYLNAAFAEIDAKETNGISCEIKY